MCEVLKIVLVFGKYVCREASIFCSSSLPNISLHYNRYSLIRLYKDENYLCIMNLSNYTQYYYVVGGHCFSISSLLRINIDSLLPSYQIFRAKRNKNKVLFQLCLSKSLPPLYPSTELSHFELGEAHCIIKETDFEYEVSLILN